MSIDSQHIASDVRSADAEKGVDWALSKFQQEFTQYAAGHTPQQTADTMKAVESQLLQTDRNFALALTADWAKQNKGKLVQDGKIAQTVLTLLSKVEPKESDLEDKPYASPFDKFMTQTMCEQYQAIASAHNDLTVTVADLETLLTENRENGEMYRHAKPFVDNNGDLFKKIARGHLRYSADLTYFTLQDAEKTLETDQSSRDFSNGKTQLLTDQERLAINDLLKNNYRQWQRDSGTNFFSIDAMAKAAGYTTPAHMQAVIKSGR